MTTKNVSSENTCNLDRKFVQANRKVFSKNNEFFFKNDSGVLQPLQEDMIVKTTGFKTRKNGFKRHLTYFSTHSQDFSWLNQVNKNNRYDHILLNFSYYN
jgi:hypothetical protein